MSVPHLLGKQIRAVRKSRGLTLERLAELSHLSVTYVGEVERGHKEPSISSLLKLAQAMGVSLRELILPLEREADPHQVSKHELLLRLEAGMREFYSREEAQAILAAVHRLPGSGYPPLRDLGPGRVAEGPEE